MSGQQSRPAMTASQITYVNTIADAVRMTIDQYHTLSPLQSATAGLLQSVATAWMEEQTTLKRMPADSFNMLASPATCRVATSQMMRRLARQVVEQEVAEHADEPTEAGMQEAGKEALLRVDDTLARLMTGSGMRDVRFEMRHERDQLKSARNYVNAVMLEHQRFNLTGERRADYDAWCSNHTLPPLPESYDAYREIRHVKPGVSDIQALRRDLLGDVVSAHMEEAVANVFKLAIAGENTTGRIMAGFGVPMTMQHTLLHVPTGTSSARSLREVQLAVGIIAQEMQEPGSRFNDMAMSRYHDQLDRLDLCPEVMSADEQAKAMQPALDYAARVKEALTYLIEGRDGWSQPEPAKASASRHTFTFAPPHRLQ